MFSKKKKLHQEDPKPNSEPFIKPTVQQKLKVGSSNDKYEQEADRVADKVVNQSKGDKIQKKEGDEEVQQKSLASEVTPYVQKMESSEEEPVQKQEEESVQKKGAVEEEPIQKMEEESIQKMEEEEAVQKKDSVEEEPVQKMEEEEAVQAKGAIEEESVQKQEEEEAVQAKRLSPGSKNRPDIETRLNNSKGRGQKLSGKTKHEMESGFGSDFSNVNIHTDRNAQEMSQELGAKAFAHGNDIYFNRGQFNPESSQGKHLLAHELTHTIQQKGMVQKKVQRAEADTRVGTSKLKDSKSLLNKHVNEVIAKGRKMGSLGKMVKYIFDALASNTSVGRSAIEDWVTSKLAKDYRHQPQAKDTKYKGVKDEVSVFGDGKIWLNPLFHILNPSIKVDGKLIGSDKLGHFFQQGYEYFTIADLQKKGEAKAKQYGESTEEGGYGLNTTGIYSNADLSANFKGMSFWRDLVKNPTTYKFDVSKYITNDWNEESNPNFYAGTVGGVVWKNLISGISKAYISYPKLDSSLIQGSASGSLTGNKFTGSMNYKVPNKTGNYSISFTGSLSYVYDPGLKAKGKNAIKGVSIAVKWKHSNGSSGDGVLTSYKEKLLQGTLYSTSGGKKQAYRKFKFYL